ncbi:MAG: HNH endonuclease [Ignavibacteria bacterium]|nr:HNH endonuclease [Ignavibacteria bacterium]
MSDCSLIKKSALSRTDGACHICGGRLSEDINKFAIHDISNLDNPVLIETSNNLPVHFLCKEVRGTYSPIEWTRILKYGIVVRKEKKIKKTCFLDVKIPQYPNLPRIGNEKKTKRISFDTNTRRNVYEKINGHCHLCGIPLDAIQKMQIDHVRALRSGGSNQLSNLLPICKICNRSKWSYSPNTIYSVFYYGAAAFQLALKDNVFAINLNRLVEENEERNKSRRNTKK